MYKILQSDAKGLIGRICMMASREGNSIKLRTSQLSDLSWIYHWFDISQLEESEGPESGFFI